MRPRIVWFNTARSPYNDFLFGALAGEAELLVFNRFRALDSHPWMLPAPDYCSQDLEGHLLDAIREARRANLVVIGGWDSKRFLLVSALLRPRVRLALWTDTPNVRRRSLLHRALRRLVLTYVFWRCDRLWATGRPGCQSLEELGCQRRKIDALPFYVDNDRALPVADRERRNAFRRDHGAADRVVILCLGRLIPTKGFDDAIRAMALVPEGAVLWIVGDGPERSRLADLTGQLGVSDRVMLLGWLQPDDVVLALDACDVLVHPALTDPFPTVVLDAMSRGRPVIGTVTAGSVEDRVEDGWNGYTIEPRHPHMLAARINALLRNPHELSLFGRRARETACRYTLSDGIALILRAAKAKPVLPYSHWSDRYPAPREPVRLTEDAEQRRHATWPKSSSE